MNEQFFGDTAGQLANEILDLAERLVNVGENLNRLARDSSFTAEAQDELNALIEAVELPDPKWDRISGTMEL
jgi:hypothetical protein